MDKERFVADEEDVRPLGKAVDTEDRTSEEDARNRERARRITESGGKED